jgi:hypothetical protein
VEPVGEENWQTDYEDENAESVVFAFSGHWFAIDTGCV